MGKGRPHIDVAAPAGGKHPGGHAVYGDADRRHDHHRTPAEGSGWASRRIAAQAMPPVTTSSTTALVSAARIEDCRAGHRCNARWAPGGPYRGYPGQAQRQYIAEVVPGVRQQGQGIGPHPQAASAIT